VPDRISRSYHLEVRRNQDLWYVARESRREGGREEERAMDSKGEGGEGAAAWPKGRTYKHI
jgi:hypothetical protein